MKDKERSKAKAKAKDKEREKDTLKKSATSKRTKAIKPEEHEEEEPIEIEIEPDEEMEEIEPEMEVEGDEGPPGGPPKKKKGRPAKLSSILDVDDDFDPDAPPDADDVVGEITIPRKPRAKAAAVDDDGIPHVSEPAKPLTRLGIIRARHEAMRREIDQIREDLESDEEE